ncbi:14469_t:CDS:2 [Acaulospora morrowiae]|uniref:Ornithine decarboxylase antizyme n=1 Tax=Acaulospora morrowiae TaxID=94023 RepID=A0A9N8WJ32_9GLOM|nr:14469_t:CDS:2 [Acaulospora morrowiae]
MDNSSSIRLRNLNSSNCESQPHGTQLLAISKRNTTSASKREYFYYSTLGKKIGCSQYINIKNIRILDYTIQDMTPEFFLNPGEHNTLSFDKTSSFTKNFFRGVPTKVDQVNIISLHDPQNCIWEGFVMDGIFFLGGNIELKERMVSIIELAEESLKCNSLVVCLDKKLPNISTVIRDFFYVGFELVWPGTIDHNHNSNDYILVGMEL